MSKERLEEIVEKIAEQLYDRIVVHETKVIIEYQDIKYLFNTIEEQVEQNKRYRELLTSRSMKQLIRLEDKGCYLPDEDREGFLKLKYAVEALEGESQ